MSDNCDPCVDIVIDAPPWTQNILVGQKPKINRQGPLFVTILSEILEGAAVLQATLVSMST